MRRVHSRILILLALALSILLFSTVAYQFARKHEADLFNKSYHDNKFLSIKSILLNDFRNSQKNVFDYAVWDQAVEFTQTLDTSWANGNLSPLISTMDKEYVCVYNAGFHLIYNISNPDRVQGQLNKYLNDDIVKKVLTDKKECHFFCDSPEGIIEVTGSPVVPTRDTAKVTRPSGYLLVGNLWDKNFLQTLENETATSVEIIPVQKLSDDMVKSDKKEKENIVIQLFIDDYSGHHLARLDFIAKVQFQFEQRIFVYYTVIPVILTLVAVILFYFAVRKWVAFPLKQITLSLDRNDPAPLKMISSRNKEFHAIATMTEASFEARKKLEEAVRELRLADEKLQHYAEDLKESNASKDKFFSILAHDLKSPFHSMLGYTEILAGDYDTFSDTERKKFINILGSAARKAYDLVENLLQWSRLQTGRIEYTPEVFDLQQEIEFSVDLFRASALRKSISISMQIKPGIQVIADKNMTRSVLQNLLSNALKFTNVNGKITISSNPVDQFIEVVIEDTGIGIPPEGLKQLFRIDDSFTRKGTAQETGTGLGLILCKEMIEKGKGRIWVESVPDIGSAFHFTLPLA